jgi:aryl-alcohol dehydrogenase-like predicted oxidoreductase
MKKKTENAGQQNRDSNFSGRRGFLRSGATLGALIDFGHLRGLTPSQVALTWLLAKKPWVVPIPGTTKEAHLHENLASADIQFTADELRELDNTVSQIKIFGDRYTAVEQQRVQN